MLPKYLINHFFYTKENRTTIYGTLLRTLLILYVLININVYQFNREFLFMWTYNKDSITLLAVIELLCIQYTKQLH